MNEAPEGFWTRVDKDKYGSEADFRSAVMQQCKLYIGLVESNRNRRAAANSFFLGLNTAVFVGSSRATFSSDQPPSIYSPSTPAVVNGSERRSTPSPQMESLLGER